MIDVRAAARCSGERLALSWGPPDVSGLALLLDETLASIVPLLRAAFAAHTSEG